MCKNPGQSDNSFGYTWRICDIDPSLAPLCFVNLPSGASCIVIRSKQKFCDYVQILPICWAAGLLKAPNSAVQMAFRKSVTIAQNFSNISTEFHRGHLPPFLCPCGYIPACVTTCCQCILKLIIL